MLDGDWSSDVCSSDLDAGIAERTKSDHGRFAADGIVDNFVPDENLQRIRARVVVVLIEHNRLIVKEPFVRVLNRNEFRLVNRRNAVFGGDRRR
jgi:hypothetical protein